MILKMDPIKNKALSLCLAICGGFLGAAHAEAHPHVWVSSKSTVLFDPEGRITGIRHDWVFDEMYSSFATQGLGKDGKPPTAKELEPLAKINVESLAEFGFFTFAKEGGKKLEFSEPIHYSLDANEKNIVTLHFTLPLKTALKPVKAFSFQVYDPTFFVSFDMDKTNPVALSAAPSGCSVNVMQPQPLVAEESKKLSDAATENFSPGADLSMKLAGRMIVACP